MYDSPSDLGDSLSGMDTASHGGTCCSEAPLWLEQDTTLWSTEVTHFVLYFSITSMEGHATTDGSYVIKVTTNSGLLVGKIN